MTQFEPSTPFFAANATFIEELYERYLLNPQGVDPSWREYFRSVTNGAATPQQRAASWAQVRSHVIGAKEPEEIRPAAGKDKKAPAVSQEQIEKFAHDSIRAIMMARAYRVRGHLIAN